MGEMGKLFLFFFQFKQIELKQKQSEKQRDDENINAWRGESEGVKHVLEQKETQERTEQTSV